jgi:membrane protein implicated in regulation of membrane protease activity
MDNERLIITVFGTFFTIVPGYISLISNGNFILSIILTVVSLIVFIFLVKPNIGRKTEEMKFKLVHNIKQKEAEIK